MIRTAGSSVCGIYATRTSPEEACYDIVRRILKKHPGVNGMQVGFLAMNIQGETGGYSVYNGFNYAFATKVKTK